MLPTKLRNYSSPAIQSVRVTAWRLCATTMLLVELCLAPVSKAANTDFTPNAYTINSPSLPLVSAPLASLGIPLPAKEVAVSEATKKARLTILGTAELDPKLVQLWWVGVSSFLMNLAGHLVLLDAWEMVGFHANYVPINRDDLAALQPEAILIGHGHFDHAADAGYIAAKSGALLVAGKTVCDQAQAQANKMNLQANIRCLPLGDKTHPKAGSVLAVPLFADLPPIQIIKHTHSAASIRDWWAGGKTQTYTPNLSVFWDYRNTNWRRFSEFLVSMTDDGGLGEPDGGTWAYWFKAGEFDLFWHDSSGRMAWGLEKTRAITTAIKTQGCADVQLTAIVGFGLLTSGYRDPLAYVQAARPKVILPTHHDTWFPIIGGGASAYKSSWENALKTLDFQFELDYLLDPEDYVKVRSYEIDNPKWQGCAPPL